MDHSICGNSLEKNIIIVAACNPSGRQSITHGCSSREFDLGKEWVSGHYQVNVLPMSMSKLKWEYGSLDSDKEKDFILKRMEMLNESIPPFLCQELAEIISESQETVRLFANSNICNSMKRFSHDKVDKKDAAIRSRSAVSLRDIQRVFNIFNFFSHDFPCISNKVEVACKYRHSMLLTIAVVYYLQLDSTSRKTFAKKIGLISNGQTLENVLSQTIDGIIKETEVPHGIALNEGLKENIFMTLICSLSQTPLMIIGPPGSAKVSWQLDHFSVCIFLFNVNLHS